MPLNDMEVRLPIHPEPTLQEGPVHYKIRLAEENGLTPDDVERLGVRYFSGAAQVPSPPTDHVRHISRRSIGVLSQDVPDIWLGRLARVCPACLSDGRSEQSAGWELQYSESCVVHGLWLIDRCTCGARLLASRQTLDRCDNCGAQLSSVKTAPAPDRVVELSKLLLSAASGVLVEPSTPSGGVLLSPIAELDSVALNGLARVFGGSGDPTIPPPRKWTERSDRLEYSWTATSLAAEVLCNWPEGLFRVLDWARRFHEDSRTYQLQRTFGPLFRKIEWLLYEPKFDFVRDEIRTYLARHWRASRTRSPRLACIPYLDMQWISAQEAQRELGTSRAMLEEHIRRGELTADRRYTLTGRERLMINHQSVRVLKSQSEACSLNLQAAAWKLGLSRQRLRRLLPLVLPEACRSVGSGWRIPTTSLDRLLESARDAETTLSPSANQTTVAAALKTGQLSDEALAHILTRATSTPELKPRAVLASGRGVTAWVLDATQLGTLLAANSAARASIPPGYCTLMSLAERWAVKQEVIYFLERADGIHADRCPHSDYRGKVVSDAEVFRFEASYVMGRVLAEELACSPKSLTQSLARRGIEPAYGPADGCRQAFYLRGSELDQALEVLRHRRRATSRIAPVTTDMLEHVRVVADCPSPAAAETTSRVRAWSSENSHRLAVPAVHRSGWAGSATAGLRHVDHAR